MSILKVSKVRKIVDSIMLEITRFSLLQDERKEEEEEEEGEAVAGKVAVNAE